MNIPHRLSELLRERGYEPKIARGANGFWLIDFDDKRGNPHCITPTSLIADQWWMIDETNEDSYSGFLREIDRRMMMDLGMTTSDAEEYNWKDEFDSEVEPDDAYEEWKCHTENGTRSPLNM